MTTITQNDYNEEVRETAQQIAEQAFSDLEYNEMELTEENAEEIITDYLLHETIEGHEWIIYTAYHLPIIQYSDNDEYYAHNFGGEFLTDTLSNNGLGGLHTAIAFWAFYADVSELVRDEVSKQADKLEQE